jgi:hypothetical protein
MAREAMLPKFRSTSRAVLLLGLCLASGACDSLSRTQSESNGGRAVLPPVDLPATAATANSAKGRLAGPSAADASSFDQIRSSLRRLVAAEESFYAENGVYTEELSRLGYRPSGGTDVRFLWLVRGSWGASGTHPQLAGRNCVIFVGREHAPPATAKYARVGKEGVPVCDAAPPRAPTNSTPGSGPAATATAASSSGSTTDTSNALDGIDPTVQMKVDLRNLARSQDTYLRVQGFYARRTAPFALQYLWHKGVTLTILSAGKESWSARATHAAEDGKSCVIWFGPVLTKPTTWMQNRVSDQALVPVCDD